MKLFENDTPRAVGVDSPWRAPFDGSLKAEGLKSASSRGNIGSRGRLKKLRKQIGPLQEVLYAAKQYSVLCIFQAMDAAGKDGTIREVFSELDPAGIRVAAFKRPSRVELAHDFLWRTTLQLPGRGEIVGTVLRVGGSCGRDDQRHLHDADIAWAGQLEYHWYCRCSCITTSRYL